LGVRLVVNIGVGAIPLALASIHPSKSDFQPIYLFSLVVGIWISIVTISIWQWVAVWRASNKHIERRALQLKKAPWARIAKVMAVIAFLQFGGAILTTGIPQIAEMSRIAFLDDPDIPNYSIRVMRNGTEAEITGGIKFGLATDFTRILRASRQIGVVHLNSIGGRIGEGEQLYNVIRDNHLTTYVSERCLSACTLAFSAGRDRILRHGAILGFHRGSFAGEDLKDSLELDGQRKIFTAAGYAPRFIVRALATPSAEMWKPSEVELLGAGVITRISNGADYAVSGFPPDVSKAYFSTALAKASVVSAAIRERFPGRYDDMVESYYKAVIDGKTEVETKNAVQQQITVIVSDLRPSAADDILVELANLYADQFAAMQKQGAAACYRFASGRMVADDMPAAIAARQYDLEARIVRTVSAKSDLKMPSPQLWKKVNNDLSARGVSNADIDLIAKDNLPDSQQARYCAVMIIIYKATAALPQAEGAQVMRSMIAAK
jgi:hypothetical protein